MDSHQPVTNPYPKIQLNGRSPTTTPLLDYDTARLIQQHLTPILRESKDWNLVYSLNQHGISLQTLFGNVKGKGE